MRRFRLCDSAGTDIVMDGPERFGHALRETPLELDTLEHLHHIRRGPPRSPRRDPLAAAPSHPAGSRPLRRIRPAS